MKSFRNFIKNVVTEDKQSENRLLENILDAFQRYIESLEKNGYGWHLDSENFDFKELYNFYNGDMPFEYFKKYYNDNEKIINKGLAKRGIYIWSHRYSGVVTYIYGVEDNIQYITELIDNEVFSPRDLSDKDYNKMADDFAKQGDDIDDVDSYSIAQYIVRNKLDKDVFAVKRLN